ncbi:reverse transcriptase [Gossypium australe]|uniref:Reverse transcriptase n=1 Tax=Gossypium australe TaxID=47621 RepID=A0A5B6V8X2_9ROSI|nr:reverse transcriptase [Gossypium australe]
MNVLSRFLDVAAQQRIFQFHPKCHHVQLTHEMFILLWVSSDFYLLSRLLLNSNKSEILMATILGIATVSLLLEYVAGRLIKSFLFSIQAFWGRKFLLPKSVLKHIALLCT